VNPNSTDFLVWFRLQLFASIFLSDARLCTDIDSFCTAAKNWLAGFLHKTKFNKGGITKPSIYVWFYGFIVSRHACLNVLGFGIKIAKNSP
jgi:hypothetical protein